MTDESGALWIASPNFWTGRSGNSARYVIIHGTAGGSSAQGIANWFAQSASQVSSHYVVGQDGTIVQCVSEADSAWGNGIVTGTPGSATPDSGNDIRDSWWTSDLNPNLITISLEHVKQSTDNSDALTDAQKQASFTLISHICDRHGIPKRPADSAGGITGHYSIDAINRSHCPGAYPWDELWAHLQNGGSMGGIPNGWDDKNEVLIAPNGHKVVLGFRDYILTHQWDPDSWPVEEEHDQNPLEISHPELGAGRQQLFRFDMLGYKPDRGVFREYVGAELAAMRQASPDIAVIKAQNSAQTQALQQIITISKPFEAS